MPSEISFNKAYCGCMKKNWSLMRNWRMSLSDLLLKRSLLGQHLQPLLAPARGGKDPLFCPPNMMTSPMAWRSWYVNFRSLSVGRLYLSQTLAAHAAPITALDFSEPYGVLVSAGLDEATKVWDLCTGEEIGRLRGHAGTSKQTLISTSCN